MKIENCIVSSSGYSCFYKNNINLPRINSHIFIYISLRCVEHFIKMIIENKIPFEFKFNETEYPSISFN